MRNVDVTAHPRAPAEPHPRRILLVEDEPDIRELLAELIEDGLEHVEVTTAADGTEAAALLATTPFDLVVSDYKMPGMNGLDLLTRLRDAQPDTPSILMTAFPDLEIALRAINEAHVQSFLQKPVDPQQVLRVVSGILGAWQPRADPAHAPSRIPQDLRQRRIP